MIETLTDFLRKKGFIFKQFHTIAPKLLDSRKKVSIFDCIDTKEHYISVFYISQKSRFLVKNCEEIIQLHTKLITLQGHNFKKNIIFINAPLCSKAKKYLQDLQWSVYHDLV